MKNRKTLQEELGRMKYLAGIITEAEAQQAPVQTPAQAPTQNAPTQQGQNPVKAQVDPQAEPQIDPAKATQTIQTNMAQGMEVLMQQLPSIMKSFTATVGDKDGKLETGEEQVAQPQQPQAQQPQAQQAQSQQPQQVKEGKKSGELMFDEEKYKKQVEDELEESLVAGLIASAPAIMQLGGKLLQKMGSKTNPNIIQKFGKTVAGAGEKLHHQYLGVIEKIISPLMPNAKPETKKKAAEAMFMVLVSTLFASHLAHPDALTAVKGKEIASYVGKLIPGVMASIGFS
jgi:flagellar motor protein MotB